MSDDRKKKDQPTMTVEQRRALALAKARMRRAESQGERGQSLADTSKLGMQSFEVQGPDGTVDEVQAPDMQSAVAAMKSFAPETQGGHDMKSTFEELIAKSRELAASGDIDRARRVAEIAIKWRDAAAASQTNMVEQSMSGVNEGIAGILGAPIDLANWLGDLPARGINAAFGTDLKTSADLPPGLGTAQSYTQAMTDTGMVSDIQPQTSAQRYGRRIGQEVGAMSIPGGAAMRGATAPLKLGAMEAASAVGSGVAGQTSQEIAPGNQTADMIASMLGGLSPVAASRTMRPDPKAPTLEALQAQRDAGYDAVRQSGATLRLQSADALASGIESTFGNRPATRRMNPKAAIAAEELAGDMRQRPPTISEVDESRQWIADNVAGSTEKGERRLGMLMKDKIDSHLSQLRPEDVTGTNRPEEVVSSLMEAREKASRIYKSQVFEAEDTGAFAKGLRRAATTGTGGNEINAIRQNVRRVLENPKLRRGYNEAELQAMRDIADGTPTQNVLRLIGRLAPTSGALPLGGFAGAAGASGATGNPLFIAPAIAGQGAKYLVFTA